MEKRVGKNYMESNVGKPATKQQKNEIRNAFSVKPGGGKSGKGFREMAKNLKNEKKK